jgi:hypothetical protein
LLHAPSRRHGKGTDRLRAAVEEVAASGIDVELRVLSGVPNAEVLAAIGQCDVVVDQLYSDTPMAALAAEAAAVGRPAIVGGYGWDELRAITRSEVLPPAFTCHPDDLADAIRHLATHHGERLALGTSARDFVARGWTPEAVAERYLALLRGELPSECWIDPARVTYVLGAGAPLEVIRASVRAVIDARGAAGLALDDRPDLVDRLTSLVASRGTEAS